MTAQCSSDPDDHKLVENELAGGRIDKHSLLPQNPPCFRGTHDNFLQRCDAGLDLRTVSSLLLEAHSHPRASFPASVGDRKGTRHRLHGSFVHGEGFFLSSQNMNCE